MKKSLALFAIGCLLTVGLSFSIPKTAQAAGLAIDCNKVTTSFEGKPTIENPCTIQDFFQQFVNVAQFAYGIIVLLGVLMIIYGGFQFLIAAGRQDKIAHGKRVITGTIAGIVVTATAYIIINFTVAAITGTTTNSMNPLRGVALVFPNLEQQQPFSGSGGGTTASCSSFKACDGSSGQPLQVLCSGTKVRDLQKQLKDLGCQCGTEDACYGVDTIACVRRFQIANYIMPSGMIDSDTNTALGRSPQPCDRTTPKDFVSNISSKLPDLSSGLSYTGLASKNATTRGCCVARATVGGETQPFYCMNDVTQRSCFGLGANNIFDSGNTNCLADPDTKSMCGLCAHTNERRCIYSGSYWCNNILNPGQQFNAGQDCGQGGGICSDGCLTGLRSGNTFYKP